MVLCKLLHLPATVAVPKLTVKALRAKVAQAEVIVRVLPVGSECHGGQQLHVDNKPTQSACGCVHGDAWKHMRRVRMGIAHGLRMHVLRMRGIRKRAPAVQRVRITAHAYSPSTLTMLNRPRPSFSDCCT